MHPFDSLKVTHKPGGAIGLVERPQRARVVCLAQLKGGVGKTTIAVSLACALHARGRDTVVLDADPQRSSLECARFGRMPAPAVPADLGSQPLGQWLDFVLEQPHDIALVDLPPRLDPPVDAAIAVSDVAVIPCGASMLDFKAAARTLELVWTARRYRDGAPHALFVPSRINIRTRASAKVRTALEQFREDVGPVVALRQAHADALSCGRWIGDYAPETPGAEEITALAGHLESVLEAPAAHGPARHDAEPRELVALPAARAVG